ncbi:hypothetical protein NLI96_g6112 [Meripilus lineatus]|uniref:Uncharacterized protein n=1 Tax=Meripilus lineatus TaxID=2056292 RepID=A0AAD5V2A2_9APHY|nr:hypothetical protein NLI96_g6112 [Physisporinus lineatus]
MINLHSPMAAGAHMPRMGFLRSWPGAMFSAARGLLNGCVLLLQENTTPAPELVHGQRQSASPASWTDSTTPASILSSRTRSGIDHLFLFGFYPPPEFPVRFADG